MEAAISVVIFIFLMSFGGAIHAIAGLILAIGGVGGYLYLRNKHLAVAKNLWKDDIAMWVNDRAPLGIIATCPGF